nr:MAG TPA: hypothetical protein [Caudoviricetes sp.]
MNRRYKSTYINNWRLANYSSRQKASNHKFV